LLPFAIVLALAIPHAAAAAPRGDDDDAPHGKASASSGGQDKGDKDEKVETESIFGFTEGSDTGEAGEREVSFGVLARQRTRISRYSAAQSDLKFEYSIRDDLKLGLGTFVDSYRAAKRPLPSDDSGEAGEGVPLPPMLTRRSVVTGLNGEAKYRILERGEKSPIGLSISFEPEWRQVTAGRGVGISLVQFQTKLTADTALISDQLFLAFNASWEPQVTYIPLERTVRDTNVELSAALTTRVREDLFVGGELRYLASFQGLSLSKPTDNGIFIGPTVYAKLSEKAYLSAAWSTRVGGKVRSEPEALPDFGNVPDPLERHHVRVRFGYSF
jgi:hypothetical protein